MMVIGSPGLMCWLWSGGGGNRVPFAPWSWASFASCGCSGRKFDATTALGMTETASGLREARRVVFSLLWKVSACNLVSVRWNEAYQV